MKLTTTKTASFTEHLCSENCGGRAWIKTPRRCFTGLLGCKGRLLPRPVLTDPETSKPLQCARNGCSAGSHLVAYWGEPLCGRCAREISFTLDETGEWPR